MSLLFVYIVCICGLYRNAVAYEPMETKNSKANELSYRLPNNTKPVHYDISVVTFIDRGEFNFSGVVQITVHVLENSKNITLHARQLTIKKIEMRDSNGWTINDVTFTHDATTEFLTISTPKVTLQRGEIYDLQISYSGELRTDMVGFYRSSYVDEKGKKVYANFEILI